MENKPVVEVHTHTQSSTTFKADAGTKKYHCGFFCQRRTDRDTVSPTTEKKLDDKAQAKV
jgi:hypothetical protein